MRSMKRARDVREQLLGLMERVELEAVSNPQDHDAIKKAICSGAQRVSYWFLPKLCSYKIICHHLFVVIAL